MRENAEEEGVEVREIRRRARQAASRKEEGLALPNRKYRMIYADGYSSRSIAWLAWPENSVFGQASVIYRSPYL